MTLIGLDLCGQRHGRYPRLVVVVCLFTRSAQGPISDQVVPPGVLTAVIGDPESPAPLSVPMGLY